MKISVIVPVYNSEKLLSRCIESICNQTYKDLEILIVDDGSTDNSGFIADTYGEKDPRIRVFHQKNKGVSAARNIGLHESSGELIAFVDSDDYIRPNMYQRLFEISRKYQVDIVTSDFMIDGKKIVNSLSSGKVYSKEEIVNSILPSFTFENAIGIMEFKNKLFAASLIKENNVYFYEGYAFQEDLMFMINIYAHAVSLYYLPEAFYEYYPTSVGLYSSYRENGGERFIAARKIMLSLIEKYGIPNINWEIFNSAFLYNISFYIYRTINYVDEIKKRKKLIYDVLCDSTVKKCCRDLLDSASSFDYRISKAIVFEHYTKAIILIVFVYSGKAGKIQKIISRLKGGK